MASVPSVMALALPWRGEVTRAVVQRLGPEKNGGSSSRPNLEIIHRGRLGNWKLGDLAVELSCSLPARMTGLVSETDYPAGLYITA